MDKFLLKTRSDVQSDEKNRNNLQNFQIRNKIHKKLIICSLYKIMKKRGANLFKVHKKFRCKVLNELLKMRREHNQNRVNIIYLMRLEHKMQICQLTKLTKNKKKYALIEENHVEMGKLHLPRNP